MMTKLYKSKTYYSDTAEQTEGQVHTEPIGQSRRCFDFFSKETGQNSVVFQDLKFYF